MTRSRVDVVIEWLLVLLLAAVALAAGLGWTLVALAAAGRVGAAVMAAVYLAVLGWVVGRGR